MLVLTCRHGDNVFLRMSGDDSPLGFITVLRTGNRVMIGFEFPTDVDVLRQEVWDRQKQKGETDGQ